MRDTTAAKAYADEQRWIAVRRRKVGQRVDGLLRGLALSGGGVRAATVARGFVEALARAGRFDRFDYLSTVSGGSYIGGAITEHMGRLGRRLPLPEADYRLASPRGHWPVLAYMLLEWVPLLLPLLLYFGFAAMLYDSPSSSALELWAMAGVGVVVLLLMWRVDWVRRRIFGASEEEARSFCVAAAAMVFAFLCVASGYGGLLALLVALCFVGARAYLRRNRHVTFTGWAGGAWRLFLVVVLSGIACSFAWLLRAKLSAPSAMWRIAAPLTVVAGLAVLVRVTTLPVVRWNSFFPATLRYQRSVAERFLPFSRWPQGRLLCTLVPSPSPFHIINTSANSGAQLRHFELTALHCGSLPDGYAATRQWLPRLTIEEAVAASGSAVDLHATGFGWGSLASIFASGTGHWIPAVPGDHVSRLLALAHANFLAKRHQEFALRLSDGGFTDNTGILALLYRRTDLIVCLDNGFDPAFSFDDLRRLCRTAVRLEVAEISVQALEQGMTALRFSAPHAGFIEAEIAYPPTAHEPPKVGRLLIVKLHRAIAAGGHEFEDFPHFSTDDQRLDEAQLKDLYGIGTALGQRFVQAHGRCLD